MFKKEVEEKYIVGFEFGRKTSQISFARSTSGEPETLSIENGEPVYNFPNVLAKRHEVNQWMFGAEAAAQAELGEALLIDNLLEKATAGEMVMVADQEFDPVALLALFFRRSLNLLGRQINTELIEAVMFTLPDLDTEIITAITAAMDKMNLVGSKLYFQGHEESVVHYILHQTPSVWAHDVYLADLSEEEYRAYKFGINYRTQPKVITVDTMVERDFVSEDEPFLEYLKGELAGSKYSGVYLVGKGFEDNWYPLSLKFLCTGKKVFRGSNLYSLGAVYALREILTPGSITENYVYLGPMKLKTNVGIQTILRGRDHYLPLLDAGKNWYDATAHCQVILGEDSTLNIVVTPLSGKDAKNIEISLDDLPARPPKTTRLDLKIDCADPSTAVLTIKDMGFGKLFPAADVEWEEIINV